MLYFLFFFFLSSAAFPVSAVSREIIPSFFSASSGPDSPGVFSPGTLSPASVSITVSSPSAPSPPVCSARSRPDVSSSICCFICCIFASSAMALKIRLTSSGENIPIAFARSPRLSRLTIRLPPPDNGILRHLPLSLVSPRQIALCSSSQTKTTPLYSMMPSLAI